MVASTIVPVVIRTPCACRCRFTCPRICSPVGVLPASAGTCTPWSRPAPAHSLDQCPRTAASPLSRTAPFHPRVRQVEPLLQKVNPQHALYSHRPPPLPRLGIMRRHQRAQLAPRHHLLHLLQKYGSP